jgi:hypothetical protein
MTIIDQPTSIPENSMYLEEKHFKENFKYIFDVDCPFFGKLMYLYMANGYDKAKISFLRWLDCLYPLFN